MSRMLAFFVVVFSIGSALRADDSTPNVLWIFVDDMSDWVGCYGDPTVPTPHIDSLAVGGVRFERAFMPSPVCSTTRSALITGTMQTTHGLHHHRTMIKKELPEGVVTVPELFRAAGYVTFNEAKEDYNFTRDRDIIYSPDFKRPGIRSHLAGTDVAWLEQLRGKKFFGQIQLKGGKIGGETGNKFPAESRIGEGQVEVPPYYPDTTVFRNAIARHYEQIAETDEQVGAIIAALKKYELWDNTVVIFFTDHGCPLPRAKQFLYEDGTKVPLIVHWPAGVDAIGGPGTVRSDLANGIDITTTSLALAGIDIPDFMEGRNLFAKEVSDPEFVVMARDRCGVAVDRIRAIRSDRFRYIKNFHTDRALYQLQYRQKYPTFAELRKLDGQGKLTPLQRSYMRESQRPAEELYDLPADPHQLNNLAGDSDYQQVLEKHRGYLTTWQRETAEKGGEPESRASLELVFKGAKGNVAAPEFDFLKN